jgi:hypothetical protein
MITNRAIQGSKVRCENQQDSRLVRAVLALEGGDKLPPIPEHHHPCYVSINESGGVAWLPVAEHMDSDESALSQRETMSISGLYHFSTALRDIAPGFSTQVINKEGDWHFIGSANPRKNLQTVSVHVMSYLELVRGL